MQLLRRYIICMAACLTLAALAPALGREDPAPTNDAAQDRSALVGREVGGIRVVGWKGPATAERGLRAPEPQDRNESAWELLDETLISVDYLDRPLESVVQDLRRQLGVNVVVFWADLYQMGVFEDAPVTLTLNDVPVRTVFDYALAAVEGDFRLRVGWHVRDGIVEIRPATEVERRMTRVYYVADILSRPSRASEASGFIELGWGQAGGQITRDRAPQQQQRNRQGAGRELRR